MTIFGGDVSISDVGSGIGAVGNLVSALQGLFSKRNAFSDIPGLSTMLQSISDQQANSAALAGGPDNPRFANLARIFEENFRTAGLAGLRQKLALDRQLLARGASPGLFNNDRRDEAANRAAMEIFRKARESSYGAATNQLNSALAGERGISASLAPFINLFKQYADTAASQRQGLAKGLGTAGQTFLDQIAPLFKIDKSSDYGLAYSEGPGSGAENYAPPTGADRYRY